MASPVPSTPPSTWLSWYSLEANPRHQRISSVLQTGSIKVTVLHHLHSNQESESSISLCSCETPSKPSPRTSSLHTSHYLKWSFPKPNSYPLVTGEFPSGCECCEGKQRILILTPTALMLSIPSDRVQQTAL